MKTHILFLCTLLAATTSYTMEWSGNSSVKDEKIPKQQVSDIKNILSNKELERAYELAQEAQGHAAEIKQEILSAFKDRESSLTQPTQNEKSTERLKKSLPLIIEENNALNELPKYISQGANVNEPVIKTKIFDGSALYSSFLTAGSATGAVTFVYLGLFPLAPGLFGIFAANSAMMFLMASDSQTLCTLLNKAINNKDMQLVEYLLAHGANVNQAVYDNIDTSLIYFNQRTPLAKALKERNDEMIQQFLSYGASIDSTLFTKDVIGDKKAFVFLLTTFLYQQAKEKDATYPTLPKDFTAVAAELASLISKLQPAEQIAFKEALINCSQDIIVHFEKMIIYYEDARKKLDAKNPRKSEGNGIPTAHYDNDKIAGYYTSLPSIITNDQEIKGNIVANPALFVFDRKDASDALIELFHTIDLNVIKDLRYEKQLEVFIDYLLEQGAYINIYFSHHANKNLHITPLHTAIMQGNQLWVKYLLAHKASPNMPTSEGMRPLQLAAEIQDAEIANLLINNPGQQEKADMDLVMHESLSDYTRLKRLVGSAALLLASTMAKK